MRLMYQQGGCSVNEKVIAMTDVRTVQIQYPFKYGGNPETMTLKERDLKPSYWRGSLQPHPATISKLFRKVNRNTLVIPIQILRLC